MTAQFLAAFVVTVFFSIMFNVSKKQLIYCGFIGAIGWIVYTLGYHYLSSKVLACFISTLVISISSHFLAKLRKEPTTVFQISGIIPLVPGGGMYYTLYYMVNNNYDLSVKYFYETIQIAASIAFAIIIVGSVTNSKKPVKKN